MLIKLFPILVALVLFLSACQDGGHFLFDDPPNADYGEAGRTFHTVFFESEPMQLAMYEPVSGTFIGMHTDAQPMPNGRVIASVEYSVSTSHATFMEVMHLGGTFPTLWVLECIAEQKIPIIVILPPEGEMDSDWETVLTKTAQEFAAFPVPMFVVFYPLDANNNWDAATYIAFFRYARALFAAHAPHVAFIWAIDENTENFMDYFPGEQAVDWVGISIFTHQLDSLFDLNSDLDTLINFYHTFHRDFPIMLNLGLSHFSTEDHRYRIQETTAALHAIYRLILTDFPRVKMVNYMDINRQHHNGHDFRISMDAALRVAYRESVRHFYFLSETSEDTFDDGFITQKIRSAYKAVLDEGRIYLDIRTIKNEMNLPIPNRTRWLDGARRADASLLDINITIGEAA